VPEENFWTLWCKGRLTEADTLTIRLGATPSGLTSAHLHHSPFFTGRVPVLRPTNSVKALKVNSTAYVDAAYCYRPSSVVCRSVGLSVCHSSEPCKNGRTNRDAIWVVGSDGPKESCIRWESRSSSGQMTTVVVISSTVKMHKNVQLVLLRRACLG